MKSFVCLPALSDNIKQTVHKLKNMLEPTTVATSTIKGCHSHVTDVHPSHPSPSPPSPLSSAGESEGVLRAAAG